MVDNASYIAKDKEFLSPALNRAFPVVAKYASGSYIYDVEGNAYLDFTSGIAVNQVGHAHPEVAKAIAEQAALCIHTSCVVHYPAVIELGEKLASILPGNIKSTFFSNSGAEAIDGAIKLSKLAKPGRSNIIVHKGGFHGRTIGGTSLTTSKSIYKRYYEPLLPGVHAVEYPNIYIYNTEADRLDYELNLAKIELQRLFDTTVHPETVAAIFIEPIMGEGGYIPAPNSYLKHLRALCDQYGILLVFDEVQCGMGRTGKWFACEFSGVVPDIIVMAKGLSGGIPLGAFSASKELMAMMPPGSHGSTFGGNPISCKAALKLIEIIERDKVLANVEARSKQVYDFFAKHYPNCDSRKITKDSSKVRLRGPGLMIGIELESMDIVNAVKKLCFENKLLLLGCGTYGNTIRLAPDLTVSEADMTKGLEIMLSAIKACTK
jgi:4-aminobutyrate aminotransferase